MKRVFNKTLKNGLKVVIVENKKKHRCEAHLFVGAGGHSTNYIDDNNKKKELKKGIAHFLEHYLIEKSIYGNIGQYYSSESMSYNGMTGIYSTEYYFSTVHDFEEALIRLINIVNKPNFNSVDIEDVKKPIIEEIKRSKDNKRRRESDMKEEAFYKVFPGNITLGEIDTIEGLTIEELQEFYDVFYRTNNQTLVINTNMSIKEVLDIIDKEYGDNKKEILVESIKEPIEVNKRYLEIIDPTEDEYESIIFKIDISKFKDRELLKLDSYLYYMTKINFQIDSDLYRALRSNNLTLYSININRYLNYKCDYVRLEILVRTKEHDKVKELILETINNPSYDREAFETIKNNQLINYINKMEKPIYEIYTWIDNYFVLGIDYIDTIKDVEGDNIEDMKKYISSLDFTNYLEVRRKKSKKDV